MGENSAGRLTSSILETINQAPSVLSSDTPQIAYITLTDEHISQITNIVKDFSHVTIHTHTHTHTHTEIYKKKKKKKYKSSRTKNHKIEKEYFWMVFPEKATCT